MQYIRVSDSLSVSREEACTPGGMVKPGYKIRVGMLADGQRVSFMDSSARTAITDSTVTLTDAETARAVAKARHTHDIRHAYLGSRAPAFTDAQAASAAAQAVAYKQAITPTAGATQVRDAETITARAMRDAAYAKRKAELHHAWKGRRWATNRFN